MKITHAICAMLLLGAVSCGPKQAPLGDTTWKLVSMPQIPGEAITSDPVAYTLTFNATDTMVYGRAACNRIFGRYQGGVKGAVSFGNIGSTRMLCPDKSYEQQFYNMFGSVNRYEVNDGELTLFDNETPLATFRAAEPTK